MEIDAKVKLLLDKVNAGMLDGYLQDLEGTDFGIHIPVEKEERSLKLMTDGFSQTENNLRVTVTKTPAIKPEDSYIVGWMGGSEDQGTQCRGSHNSCIGHCKGTHGGPIKNCRNHPNRVGNNDELVAPKLDYDLAVEQLKAKKHVLNSLAREGFGMTLLHGHNSEFTFTKLPPDYVSVISGGVTSFRKLADVQIDSTFVPTVWRFLNGKLQVAGGHSDQ